VFGVAANIRRSNCIAFDFRRQTQPLPAFFMNIDSPISVRTSLPPGRSGERAADTLTRLAGYRRPPGENNDATNIRSNTHARINRYLQPNCPFQ